MGKSYKREKINGFPKEIYLDKQKDIKVTISRDENSEIVYEISVPNFKSEKILKNLAGLTQGEYDEKTGIVKGKFNESFDNTNLYTLNIERFNSIEIDLENNTIEMPRIPVVLKTLMAQKNELVFDRVKFLDNLNETKTDLHSHYTAMLDPEKLIALGLKHNINYPVSHIYALGLKIPDEQREQIEAEIGKTYGSDILEQIRSNNGNWKVIKDIFVDNKINVKQVPFKDLIIGEPSEDKSENFNKIMLSCSLPREAQNTFTDMKDTYMNRAPFTNAWGKKFDENLYNEVLESSNISSDVKEIFERMCDDRQHPDFKDNNLQEDMLLWIARDAREEGIDYIEMSHNALSNEKNQRYLDTYDKIMDKVEQETGTRLRMLVGVSRTTSYGKFKDNFEHVKQSLNSKYVAGIDVLGEETNATQRFEKILATMTKYALKNDPDMVIRVHAGETDSYEANVLKAVEIVYEQYLKELESTQEISSVKKPNLRIGHGLHGIAEEMKPIDKDSKMGRIIERLSKFGVFKNNDKLPENMSLLNFMAEMETVIIERCLSSNVLLTHENALGKEPLKTYIDNGVKCVLGTDGYGVYGTSSQEEVLFATTEGINEDYIDMICETEREVIERSKAREEYIENRDINIDEIGIEDLLNNEVSSINLEPHKAKVEVEKEFPREDKRTAIVVSGGSFNKYDKNGNYLHSQMQEQDEELLKNLIDVLDPEENVFVIGGRLEAQERRLVELLGKKNEENERNGKSKFEVVMATKSFLELSMENQAIVKQYGIKVVESGQKEELETYKRLEKDIFLNDERKSDLLVFDGYQQAQNLLSVASRGQQNRIFYGREKINEGLDDRRKILDGIEVPGSSKVDISRFFGNSIQNRNLVGKNATDNVDKETEERLNGIDEKQVEGVSQR